MKHILIPFTDEQVETLSELTQAGRRLYQLEDLDAMENGDYAAEEGLDLEAFGLEEGAYADGDYEVAIEPWRRLWTLISTWRLTRPWKKSL